MIGLTEMIAAAAAVAGVGEAAASTKPAANNKAIVQKSFDAWIAGTGSPFDLLDDNAVWTIEGHSAESGTYVGKQAFIRKVIAPFNARMSVGLKPQVRNITAEGDRVVILFNARATARDGKPYVNSYAWFFEMKDGRVVRANAFFDAIAFNDLWSRVTPAN